MQKSCLHSNIRSSFLTLCGWLLLYFNSSVGPFKKITWKEFSFIIAARKALEKSFLPHFPSFSYFRQHVLAINHWKWGSAQRGKIWEMFFTPWIYQKLCCLFIFCHLIWFGVRNDTVMDLPTHCYYYCEVCVCLCSGFPNTWSLANVRVWWPSSRDEKLQCCNFCQLPLSLLVKFAPCIKSYKTLLRILLSSITNRISIDI